MFHLFSVGTKIRKYCNVKYYPIKLIPGDSPPVLRGRSFHYETRGGRKIYHPSAYSKRGWSNMRYVPSTICIEVGENWDVLKNFPELENSVDYLCYMLERSNCYVTYSDRRYSIYRENSLFAENLTLLQFKSLAKRLIKLIVFS